MLTNIVKEPHIVKTITVGGGVCRIADDCVCYHTPEEIAGALARIADMVAPAYWAAQERNVAA